MSDFCYKIKTKSLEETQNFSYEIGKKISKGIILSLNGDLGAGKTTFVQGLAKGLDVPGL